MSSNYLLITKFIIIAIYLNYCISFHFTNYYTYTLYLILKILNIFDNCKLKLNTQNRMLISLMVSRNSRTWFEISSIPHKKVHFIVLSYNALLKNKGEQH